MATGVGFFFICVKNACGRCVDYDCIWNKYGNLCVGKISISLPFLDTLIITFHQITCSFHFWYFWKKQSKMKLQLNIIFIIFNYNSDVWWNVQRLPILIMKYFHSFCFFFFVRFLFYSKMIPSVSLWNRSNFYWKMTKEMLFKQNMIFIGKHQKVGQNHNNSCMHWYSAHFINPNGVFMFQLQFFLLNK